MLKNIIVIAQIIIGILLSGAILIQAKGTGLGAAWGGSGASYRSKRGLEKILFVGSIVLAGAFILISIASAFLI